MTNCSQCVIVSDATTFLPLFASYKLKKVKELTVSCGNSFLCVKIALKITLTTSEKGKEIVSANGLDFTTSL